MQLKRYVEEDESMRNNELFMTFEINCTVIKSIDEIEGTNADQQRFVYSVPTVL